MKLIIVLAAMLLISNCAAMSFVPTTNDLAWMNGVIQDTKVLTSDMQLITFAADNNNLPSIKTYCDLVAADAQTALGNSQQCAVSTELQESKYYWELALSFYISGSEKSSSGIALLDGTMVTEGANMIMKGTEYMMLASRALNTISTPSYASRSTDIKPYAGPTSGYAGAGQGAKVGMEGANLLDINSGDKPTTTAYQPINNQVQSGRYPANKDTKV